MSRTFTPSERAAILSARKDKAPIAALAKRFHVGKGVMAALCEELAQTQTTGALTPAPYATGYRTAVYNVRNGASKRNISWG
jgi:hypothetical protein